MTPQLIQLLVFIGLGILILSMITARIYLAIRREIEFDKWVDGDWKKQNTDEDNKWGY